MNVKHCASIGSQAPPDEVSAFEGLQEALPSRFGVCLLQPCPIVIRFCSILVQSLLITFLVWSNSRCHPSCLDLSSSSLGGPSCSSSLFPYSQYEVFRTFLECRNRFLDLGDFPQPGQDALENLPEDTLLAYFNFYAVTHPESLADVPAARRRKLELLILHVN